VPDPALVTELADALGHLSAERWVGAARPELGLDRPRVTVTAEVGSGNAARSIEVDLGAPVGAGSSFARTAGDPAVFVASPTLETAATRWLVDRTALLVDVDRMTRATLVRGDKKLVLEQSGGGLRIADSAATERAAKLRDALRELLADAAVSVGPPVAAQGFDKPTLRISVELGRARFDLRFGARDAYRGTRVYYARREDVPATFAVAESRVAPLLDAVR
jgi:hypothetical protein